MPVLYALLLELGLVFLRCPNDGHYTLSMPLAYTHGYAIDYDLRILLAVVDKLLACHETIS